MSADLTTLIPWTTLVALVSLWWQHPERGLRPRLTKDLDIWARLPADWDSRDRLKVHIEHQVTQLTDRTVRQRLTQEAKAVRGLLLVCFAFLTITAVGADIARDRDWAGWAQTGLAYMSAAMVVIVGVYSLWWVVLVVRRWGAP